MIGRIDTSIIDGIIYGRVEPIIYAFNTHTVPNYLKVGDTYRPLNVRLDEWRKYFPDLDHVCHHPATINDKDVYFRDYSVHDYLENEKRRMRLKKGEIPDIPYYSNEFFFDATKDDVDAAINDIVSAYNDNLPKYQFYKVDESRLPMKHHYERVDDYPPRPNQKGTIAKFENAIKKGRDNLLMFAVMRFGKSFTSMCCAVKMNAKLVVIVSAKADVKEEWKKTVESHKKFVDYEFIDGEALKDNHDFVSEKLKQKKKIALFLTLQDLQGNVIKERHKDIFKQKIDLLIIDETHFGARAEKYGQAISLTKSQLAELKTILKDCDEDLWELGESIKVLDAKIRLHLSGTPYRILMGDEFSKDDIIAFYQFTDIVKDQKAWDEKHLVCDEYQEDEIAGCHKKGEVVKEWHNPYFGFPQMVRFAFNPTDLARKKISELKKEGISFSLSDLFLAKDGKFQYPDEVLNLFEVIDGVKRDDCVLGFLDYDKIKNGQMCRHIVCVLPFRASCDALAEMLEKNKRRFKNLGDYEIINIAGNYRPKKYDDIKIIKSDITRFEKDGKKTLSLTVNRMLTGSTVEEWDTMVFLKDTNSPQEYDQAIFRLQSQYVKTFRSENGDVIRYNMKPQTLLVDFSPSRMFDLQEKKSKIYDVNVEKNGNSNLVNRIEEELSISPIICINAENKMVKVTASDVMDEVRKYNQTRNVMDEARLIAIDKSILDFPEIKEAIRKLEAIDSKSGLNFKPHDGDETEMDVTGSAGGKETSSANDKKRDEAEDKNPVDEDWTKKIATFYAQILFFAFLTESEVISLSQCIKAILSNDDNQRIANNLGIDVNILKIFQIKCNPFILSGLDYKIQNINDKSHDENLTTQEKVEHALNKFGKLSVSEIVTPARVTSLMVEKLPEDVANGKILDIASKQGEFAIALINRFGDAIKNKIYSIPTSKTSYEFTLKIYKLLGMPLKNVFSDFVSYDLFNPRTLELNDMIIKQLKMMKFSTVIGNPPYQELNDGNGNGSNPIYHKFIDIARDLSKYGTLIHPSRFLFDAGKTPKDWNKKIKSDPNLNVAYYSPKSSDIFDNVDVKGGIAITHWDTSKEIGPIGNFLAFPELKSILSKVVKKDFKSFSSIVYPRDLYRLTEDAYKENPEIEGRHSKGHRYDLSSSAFKHYPELFHEKKPNDGEDYIKIYGKAVSDRLFLWIKRKYIKCPDNIDSYKVFVPKANGTGAIGEVLSTPVIGLPVIGHTLTFLSIGNFDSEEKASAVLKYVKTKFARTLLGTLKVTQDNPKETWLNVPMQNFEQSSDIDWTKSVEEIDRQLYAKYGLTDEEINFIETMIKPMG